MWGGSIKIGARPFWGRGVFVLVISNINIGFQKLLTLPLTCGKATCDELLILMWLYLLPPLCGGCCYKTD